MVLRKGRLHYPCRKCGKMFPRYGKCVICDKCSAIAKKQLGKNISLSLKKKKLLLAK